MTKKGKSNFPKYLTYSGLLIVWATAMANAPGDVPKEFLLKGVGLGLAVSLLGVILLIRQSLK